MGVHGSLDAGRVAWEATAGCSGLGLGLGLGLGSGSGSGSDPGFERSRELSQCYAEHSAGGDDKNVE